MNSVIVLLFFVQKLLIGLSFVIFWFIVCMMCQLLNSVLRFIDRQYVLIIYVGGVLVVVDVQLFVISSIQMMLIVFCVLLLLWFRLYRLVDSSCSWWKCWLILLGVVWKYSYDMLSMNSELRMKLSSGEMKMNVIVFSSLLMFSEFQFDFVSVVLMRLLISVCDEFDGILQYYVIMFQLIVLISVLNMM